MPIVVLRQLWRANHELAELQKGGGGGGGGGAAGAEILNVSQQVFPVARRG